MERKDTFGVHFVLCRMPTGRSYVYARIVVNKTKCELGMKQQINPSDWNEANNEMPINQIKTLLPYNWNGQ